MKNPVVFVFLLFLASVRLLAQDVVINEIMYNPEDNDVEWVELYNKAEQPIDISQWYIIDNDVDHQPVIIPENTLLSGRNYYTVVIDGGPYIPFSPGFVASGLFGLSNSGDAVNLYDSQHYERDKVVYQDQSPWPKLADGEGFTLELNDVDSDNADPDNWEASLIYNGTPNGENSINITEPYLQLIYPNGTEYIEKGKKYPIEWGALNYSGPITLKLINEENDFEKTLASGLENTTAFEWIPQASVPEGEDYSIQAYGENNEPWDVSDRSFHIIPLQEVPSIAITEIMYHPPESESGSLEYIELYNNESVAVSLKGFFFSDGIDFEFPEMEFPPKSFLLLAEDAQAISTFTGKEALQWSGGRLANDGENLVVKDRFYNIVDKVSYDDKFPWDSLADGYGSSLAICEPLADNSLPGNWHSSTERFYTLTDGTALYGTPGEKCEFSQVVDVSSKINVKIFPNPVSDKLTIKAERGSYKIKVYTLMGKLVKQNTLKGRKLKIDFAELNSGFYVMELINSNNTNQREYYKVERL